MAGSQVLRLTMVALMAALTMVVGAPTLEPASIPGTAPSPPAPSPPAPSPAAPTAPPSAAPPPARPVLDPRQLELAVVPTIVAITADTVTTSTAGTGVVLSRDGLVVTNHHVVDGAQEVSARSFGTGATYEVQVLGYDSTKDLAVLRLGGASAMATAVLGDRANVTIGDRVTAIGNAEGDGDAVAASGAVIGLDQALVARSSADGSRNRLVGMIEIDAAVRPGDSGGPLVDETGAVIGINTAGNAETDPNERVGPPRSYAIPIDVAMSVVDQVRSGVGTDTVRVGPTPVLGITVTNHSRGAEVLWVSLWSPAEDAGMRTGDVITAVDGRPLASSEDLTAVMMRRSPGDTIGLTWVDREGATHDEKIVLEEGPPR